MEDHQRFSELFSRYTEKTITAEERTEFFDMVRSGAYNNVLEHLIGER